MPRGRVGTSERAGGDVDVGWLARLFGVDSEGNHPFWGVPYDFAPGNHPIPILRQDMPGMACTLCLSHI